MKSQLFTYFLLLLALNGYGQLYRITGKVVFQDSLTPISKAKILLSPPNSQGRTNKEGVFILESPPGQKKLTISCESCIEQTFPLDLIQDTVLTFEIPSNGYQLEEVMIYGQTSMVKGDLSKSTLTIEQIKKLPIILGEVDPVKSLALLPGIQQGNEVSGALVVRGGKPDQNLFLYDDITLYNPYHLLGIFGTFPPTSVSSVDVYKGNFPASLGNRTSAVLKFHSPLQDSSQTREAGIGLLSSYVGLQGDAGTEGRGRYFLSARTSYLSALTTPLYIDYANPNQFDKTYFNYWLYDMSGGLSWDMGQKGKISLSFIHSNDRYQVREGRFRLLENLFRLNWQNQGLALRHEKLIKGSIELRQALSLSSYRFKFGDEEISRSIIDTSQINRRGSTNLFMLTQPKYEIALSGSRGALAKWEIGSSAELLSTQYLIDGVPTQNQRGFLTASWLSTYWTKGPLSLTAGLRAVWFTDGNQSFEKLNPRLSAGLKLSRRWQMQMAYSEQTQFLQQISSTNLGLPNEVWVLSQENLLPLQGRQISLGLQTLPSKARWSLQLDAFYRQTSNNILFQPNFIEIEQSTPNDLTQLIRDGNGEAMGIEGTLQADLGKWNGWMSYTLSRSRLQFPDFQDNQWLPALTDRRHMLNVVGSKKLNDKWDFSFQFILQSGRPIFVPSAIIEGPFGRDVFLYPDEFNRFPLYHRLDINWLYHAKPNRTWRFGIYNVYNRLNPIALDVRVPSRIISNNLIRYTPGRIEGVSILPILPSISYSWKF
ncbi:MAG: TonB-dependent receptor plug domain-containing protein [Bacteroidota bacterium]